MSEDYWYFNNKLKQATNLLEHDFPAQPNPELRTE